MAAILDGLTDGQFIAALAIAPPLSVLLGAFLIVFAIECFREATARSVR